MKLILILLLHLSLFAETMYSVNSGSDKAMAFVNSLSKEEKKTAVFPFNEMNRYEGHYLPAAMVSPCRCGS